jgi:hypothetical protein
MWITLERVTQQVVRLYGLFLFGGRTERILRGTNCLMRCVEL